MTSYRFYSWRCQPCCICFGVLADHPRSAFRGLNSVLKLLVRRLIVPEILRFIGFGLKLPIHAPFWEFLGHIFLIWRHSSSWRPKGPSLGRKTSFEPFSVRICVSVRPGRRIDKKRQANKKVTIVLYFPYLGRNPTTWPIRPKSCMVGDVHDVITCAKFQIEIFMGYTFTGESNFRFSYWFFA